MPAIRKSLPKVKKFACDHKACNKAFVKSSDLSRHKGIHVRREDRKHGCPYAQWGCVYRTTQKSNLKTHITSMHKKERAPCDLCQKTFSDRSGLHKHRVKIHSVLTSRQMAAAVVEPGNCPADVRADSSSHDEKSNKINTEANLTWKASPYSQNPTWEPYSGNFFEPCECPSCLPLLTAIGRRHQWELSRAGDRRDDFLKTLPFYQRRGPRFFPGRVLPIVRPKLPSARRSQPFLVDPIPSMFL